MKKIAKLEVIKPGSNPDIDSDYNTEVREHVLKHTAESHGHDKIANITTFTTLAAKGAFKALCTIYKVPFAQSNKIASLIPKPIEGVECTIDDIFNPDSDRYDEGAEFRSATAGSEWEKIIEGARRIEGRNKSVGMHPCGVIISSQSLSEAVPLQTRQTDSRISTQWTYTDCEDLGLIKMDFLGLDTVDLIQNTVENIRKNGKTPPNMLEIIHGDMDDAKTYEMLRRGETIGVFQLASEGVMELLKRMEADQFEDIVATTALYRPGPMGMQSHVKYADRKTGREEIDYPVHPDFKNSPLEKILEKTQGLTVYQEQIIQIASQISGMTLQEGDDLRKAMGKKKKDVMDRMRPIFISGGEKNGYSNEAMIRLWDTVAEFARYGFNRCAHGDTIIIDEFGRKHRLRNLYKIFKEDKLDFKIMSMWEDGEIRPHSVRRVSYEGKAPLYEIKTESGRSIKVTKEHRLLTTNGYGTIENQKLSIGSELIIDETERKFGITDKERNRRKGHLTSYNQSEKGRLKSSETMKKTQSEVTFEQRSAWQNEIQKNNPNRTDNWQKAAQARLAELRKDPVWVQNFAASMAQRSKEGFRGWGKVTKISDGRLCDSIVEAAAAEYLLARGVEFELHKVVENPVSGVIRISDFYANGIYFEMDGLCRGEEWFRENKYGEVPFVYLTPYNFVDKIDEALSTIHVENGDKIVEIIEPRNSNTKVYDIEMDLEGPSNFIANDIVSHNSHSVAYAMVAYQSAFLKANYPVEFMAALISQNIGEKDKILTFLKEARRMGLKVGTVDINASEVRVAPDYTGKSPFDIVYGLGGVNAVSNDVAEIIVKERDRKGKYKSIQDLANRCVPLGVSNKRVYENLALAGAFDDLKITRKSVVDNLAGIIYEAKTKATKGASLFDMMSMTSTPKSTLSSTDEYPYVEKLKKEANVIGLYLTGHPLDHIGKGSRLIRSTTISKLLSKNEVATVTIAGSITEIEKKIMRRGKSVAVTIDDGTGYIKAFLNRNIVKGIEKFSAQDKLKKLYVSGDNTVTPDVEAIVANQEFIATPDLEKNDIYVINLTFRPERGDSPAGARVNSIRPLHLSDNGSLPLRIRFKVTENNEENIKKLYKILPANLDKKIPGEYPIHVSIFRDIESHLHAENESVYLDAITEMKKDAKNNVDLKKASLEGASSPAGSKTLDGKTSKAKTKKKASSAKAKDLRTWPPKEVHNHIPSIEEPNASHLRAVETLTYKDTGFTTDKNADVDRILEKYVGIDNFDYGVFDESLLND